MKIISIWKLIRNIPQIRIHHLYGHHPPLTYRTSNIPPPVNPAGNSRYHITIRMKLFWTWKLFGMDQLARIHHPYVCQMTTTPPAWYLPPPDTLSGNYPKLAVHPQMNFHSEQSASYYVRAPITIHLSCHAFVCYACFIFTVSPPP